MPELGHGLVTGNRLQRKSRLFSKLHGTENSENGGSRTRHQGDIGSKFDEFLLHLGDKRVRREDGNFERVEEGFGIEQQRCREPRGLVLLPAVRPGLGDSRIGVFRRNGIERSRNKERSSFRQFKRLDERQSLADALGKSRSAANEERHIGAKTGTDGLQRFERKVQVPQTVEQTECCRGIGTASAKPSAQRHDLRQVDVSTEVALGIFLERLRRLEHEVRFQRIVLRFIVRQVDFAIVAERRLDGIAGIDGLENGSEVVVAVFALADDIKKQINLCWSVFEHDR